jgi:hypothetical protein
MSEAPLSALVGHEPGSPSSPASASAEPARRRGRPVGIRNTAYSPGDKVNARACLLACLRCTCRLRLRLHSLTLSSHTYAHTAPIVTRLSQARGVIFIAAGHARSRGLN